MTRTTPLLATVLVCLALAACSSGRSPTPATSPAPAPPAASATSGAGSDVAITVDASRLPADRRATFDRLSGSARFEAALRDQMLKQQRRPAPPAQVDVSVTAFRLRSTATSVWFGAMAGGDVLDVDVVVKNNGQEVKRIKTGSGQIRGGLIAPSAEGRFERLVEATAERVVEQL
jgi:hypothetical protein